MITETLKPVTREEQFIRLYKTVFPSVAAFVRKMNGSLEEAQDIFQDALIIWYEKQATNNFTSTYEESAYIKGIARHLWYKKFNENKTTTPLPETVELTEVEEPKVSASIMQYVELAGKKCLSLLRSFYYDKLSMKEIATQYGFSGERSATAQKFKCLEKVREAVKERSLSKEDFYE